MPSLLRSVLASMFVALPSFAFGQVWIESFTGMTGNEKPNGYRYNRDIFPQQIEVFFSYATSGAQTAGITTFINGVPAGFNCGWADTAPIGSGSCFAIVPYDCGKMTVVVRRTLLLPPQNIDSKAADVFVYDDPECLPQCDSCQLGGLGQGAGGPVNVATGKLWYRTTDLALSGPFGLTFARWYDNQTAYSGELGFGWRHTYSPYLDLSQSGSPQNLVKFFDEEGRVTYFTNVGATPTHDQTSGADLVLNAGVYTLTTWDNRRYAFDSAGRLTSLTDRIGNVQTITRDREGRSCPPDVECHKWCESLRRFPEGRPGFMGGFGL